MGCTEEDCEVFRGKILACKNCEVMGAMSAMVMLRADDVIETTTSANISLPEDRVN